MGKYRTKKELKIHAINSYVECRYIAFNYGMILEKISSHFYKLSWPTPDTRPYTDRMTTRDGERYWIHICIYPTTQKIISTDSVCEELHPIIDRLDLPWDWTLEDVIEEIQRVFKNSIKRGKKYLPKRI